MALLAFSPALASGSAGGGVGPSTSPAADTLILDVSAYCRAHVQFGMDRLSPAGLRADGEEVLGKRAMGALKRGVRRRLGRKFDEVIWMDHAYHSFQWLQYGGSRDAANPYAYTLPPSAAWASPGFDDSAWLYQRKPLMAGPTSGWFRRAGFFRFRFQVGDPARAGRLTLAMTYRGGARVLVNGQEIARGHLPEGPLGPEARGEPYGLGAYVKLDKDGSPAAVEDRRGRGTEIVFVGELPGSFERAPQVRDRNRKVVPGLRSVARRSIDRATFERVGKARRRALGPLTIPARLLRKGTNVLAVEVRVSDIHPISLAGRKSWKTPYYGDVAWSHGQLSTLELRSRGGGVPSVLKRPAGVRLRAEDMHRHIISSEFVQDGIDAGVLRVVGACNGSFSGQIVISTDRELTELKLAPSELRAADGSTIPAAAMQVFAMVPHRLDEWRQLGWGRGGMRYCTDPFAGPAGMALDRHGPAGVGELAREKRLDELRKLMFFDHISAVRLDAPGAGDSAGLRRVAGGTCRPVWVRLNVPADARPGRYKGSIRVQARGMAPASIPVEAEVYGWRIPRPLDFQANAALEQSPYGVARQYKVALWSDEHFKLMELSFRQLGLIGNDWLNVPVIDCTEFGNVRDPMIKWIRRADGSLAFDFAVLDRYLDLAVKHWGRPAVINFVVMHGTVGDLAEVQVTDEATGETEALKLDNRAADYQAAWRAFASALYGHMRSRGLAGSMYWGFAWDSVADAELVRLLASVAPDVWWTAGPHRGKEQFYFRAYSQLLPFQLTAHSRMGWRTEDFHVLLPRGGGSLIAGPGIAFPFNFRLMVDRALVVGMNGVGRMGADYWADTFIRGMRKEGFLRAGMPNHFMLWPGTGGAEPSARFMALIEGFQETEARIFLEQMLLRNALPEELAGNVREALFEHHRGTLFIPSMNASHKHVELCRDWQDRSRRLFSVAAEVARAVGLDPDAYRVVTARGRIAVICRIAADVPARGRKTVRLNLRGWTPEAREWTIASDRPWIVPARTRGKAAGHQNVEITIDAARLKPGATATGSLTVTDLSAGKTHKVEVAAAVSKLFEHVSPTATLDRKQLRFIPDDGMEVINAVPGEAASKSVSFFNRSAAAISWKASASLPWLKVAPSAGKAAPGERVTLKVTAAPAAADVGRHEATLTVSEAGGTEAERIKLAVYALAPHGHAASLPKGEGVLLDAALHKAMLVSRKEWRARWCAHEILYVGKGAASPMPKDGKERGQPVENVITMPAPSETVYRLDGRGFRAFSARVDIPVSSAGYKYWDAGRAPPPDWVRVRFEVYVDGELRAHSGWMGVKDDLRTLVVEDLRGAKRLRLVTRFKKYPPYAATVAWWDGRFYK